MKKSTHRPFTGYLSHALICFAVLCFSNGNLSAQNSESRQQAFSLVSKNAVALGLSEAQLRDVIISDAYYDKILKVDMVYMQQSYKGIPVFNAINTVAFRDQKVATKSNSRFVRFNDKTADLSPTPALPAAAAVSSAAKDINLSPAASPKLLRTEANGRLNVFDNMSISGKDITAALLWVPVAAKELRLSWQVRIVPVNSSDYWLINVDAATGYVISKINLTVYCDWGTPHNNKADNGEHLAQVSSANKNFSPLGGGTTNATYRVVPFPVESPNHIGATTALVTNPWLLAGTNNGANVLGWQNDGTTEYNFTRGNNVWAKEDRAADNETTIGASATSTTNAPDYTFDFPYDPNAVPTTATFQKAATTNLFYWNNIVHDVAYQYGFTEVSGNFQNNNLGNGGLGGDLVLADAQDGSGTNNANFSTPEDGDNGRMQMFLFSSTADRTLFFHSPASLAGNMPAVESGFSNNNKLTNVGPVTGKVVLYDTGTNVNGCTALTGTPLAGKIALMYRGSCNFVNKVKNAQNAGAIGVIVIQNTGDPSTMGGNDNTITIPAVMVSRTNGDSIVAALGRDEGANVTMNKPVQIDGDFDNGVIVHEYGHGISTRLTGGPANSGCLSNAEQMGEGWSDYYALMLTTNWATASAADSSRNRGVGTYVLGQNTKDGGIRTYPYTTNMSVNPWTYDMLATNTSNGEVHMVGEIWTAALWDMTWNLIAVDGIGSNLYDATAKGGNIVSMNLVTQGLKLQPCSPGFLDGRDAILKADSLLYDGKYSCTIWRAFARRGMGAKAAQGNSNNIEDQVADYTIPSSAIISKTANRDTLLNNSQVTYTLKTSCQCAAISGFKITDTLPANVTYVSGGTYNPATRTVTFDVPELNIRDSISFAVTVTVNNGTYQPATESLNEPVTATSIPVNFIATTTSTAIPPDTWHVDNTVSHSAPSSFKADNTDYTSEQTLTSVGLYSISGFSTVSFWHYYNTEAGYDGGLVEISLDAGITWIDAGPYITKNGYNSSAYVAVSDVRKAFGGNSGSFIQTVINLSAFKTQNIKIRFRLFCDEVVKADGWYVDDIIIRSAAGVYNKVQLFNSANELQSTDNLALPVNDVITYTFTGNGAWTVADNWAGKAVPPVPINSGYRIFIDPAGKGQCIYSGNLELQTGGILTVMPGKVLNVNP